MLSRGQAHALGLGDHDLRRLVRRREQVQVHPGVYVDHTGPLTWHQRAWAAVLYAAPAALCAESALRAEDGPGRRPEPGPPAPIHVAIRPGRRLRPPPGVVVHRLTHLDAKVRWNTSPPRLRTEEAVLDVAAVARDELAAIGVLADAVRARRTTAERLAAALDGRSRIARRRFLAAVIGDVGAGTCSVLEHAYLTRVELPHGLPTAGRQVRESARGPVYRDVLYEAHQLIVELDGRTFHTSVTDRDRDLDRDLHAALDGRRTVRLGWGQVFPRACWTAAAVGRLLRQRGWHGSTLLCPQCSPGPPGPQGPRR